MRYLDDVPIVPRTWREWRETIEYGTCIALALVTEATVSKFVRDRALHYLANRQKYGLTERIRYQLTEVVECYTRRCDEGAARAGIAWMRKKERMAGRIAHVLD